MSQREILTLDNGLRVVLENLPERRLASAGIWVPFGSRFEDQSHWGFAHFVEHMLFKGTKQRTYLDIARAIDRLGGNMNATTSKEITNYYVTIASRHLGVAIDVLGDMYYGSTFPEKEFDTEKKVILEEIRMSEDDPDDYIFDLFYENAFSGGDLAHSIAGTQDSIRSSNRDSLYNFYLNHYGQRGAVLSLSGGLYSSESERSELIKKINETFNTESIFSGSSEYAAIEKPSDFRPGKLSHTKKTLEQIQLILSLPGIPQEKHSDPAVFIFTHLLGGTMSSRLFRVLREERGLAYSVGTFHNQHVREGILAAYVSTSPESFPESVEVMLAELDSAFAGKLDNEEIEESKSGLAGSLEMAMEGTYARANFNAKSLLYFNELLDWSERIRLIENFPTEELVSRVKDVIGNSNYNATTLGSLSKDKTVKIFEKAGLSFN